MRPANRTDRSIARAGAGLVLGALLLAGTIVAAPTIALAQDVPAAPPGNDAMLRDTPAVNRAMPQALPAAQGATAGDLGEHQMTGVVRETAPDGTLVVDVGGRSLSVLFPATALSRLATGDRVTLTVAVQKLEDASERLDKPREDAR